MIPARHLSLHLLAGAALWCALALCVAALTGCTDESGTREALAAEGFTDVVTTGFAPFACSDSDSFSTGFRAKNANGRAVSGVVCCGFLKGCTVRW